MKKVRPHSETSTLIRNSKKLQVESVKRRFSFKYVFLVGLLLVITWGIAYQLGIHEGYNQYFITNLTQNNTLQSSPSPSPTPRVTTAPEPTKVLTESVTVPSNWNTFSETDPDDGVSTSLSLPPGWQFNFSGSEFTIREKDFYAAELWDYSNSVRGALDSPKNIYSGEYAAQWYQDLFNGKFKEANQSWHNDRYITSVIEHKIGKNSYLEVMVDSEFTDEPETHYILVQNGIVHIIKPVSDKSQSSSAVLRQYMPQIMASLSSRIVPAE